jgi:hypothetical protein
LLNQFPVLLGGGVSRWLTVPSAFGDRYLWVRVTADVGRPEEQLDRPDVRLTLRNQALRQRSEATATSSGWTVGGQVRGGIGGLALGHPVHGGHEVEAGYRWDSESSHEEAEKSMEIYRAQTREGSVEFQHEVAFHIEMGITREMPAAVGGPASLVRKPALAVAGWTGHRRDAMLWWQSHKPFVQRFPEPLSTGGRFHARPQNTSDGPLTLVGAHDPVLRDDAGTIRGDVRLLVPRHLVVDGRLPDAPARSYGQCPRPPPCISGPR